MRYIMGKKQPAWYEQEIAKDMMGLMGGRALRGIMSNYFSSKIYQGKVGLTQVARYLEVMFTKEQRRALIIVDSFTKKYTKKVTEYLDLIDMEYRIWDGAKPEVPIETVYEGASICEEFKPLVLIAIGGGSVIDTAKVVMINYERPDANLFMILPYFGVLGLRKKIRFLIAIPTTSGTGSEVTQAAVITDTNRSPPKKLEVMSDEIIPDITILDNDFVKDMPPSLTMGSGLDALSHAVGSFVSNWGSSYIDAVNITSIKETLKYLPRAYKYGAKDIEARDHMQMAALMAGIGFGNTIPGIEHSLGHSFGKIFKVHHGISVGLFLPYSVAFQAKVTDRWKELCPIFGVEVNNIERKILLKEFVDSLKSFFHSLDAPSCVKDLKEPQITKEDYFSKIELLAEYADDDAVSLTSFRSIGKDIYLKIFQYAWDGKEIDF
jgi:alcohol dehydrogenase class IV